MHQYNSVQRMLGCLLAIVLSTAIPIADGNAATTENFMAKTTADLIALCNTDPSQSNYIAAIHFCEGFATGAYQYYLSVAADSPTDRYVCLPNPPPSRDSVKAAFVAWAQANPDSLTQAPVDSLFRYLGTTYPCSAN
ncbi:MAG TPA: Rap1a/Tai family immunity protein [Rhizomicrobium sp.]|nr:Rap1a/Tai family immunity protein [Rhizomicrobium sp.]